MADKIIYMCGEFPSKCVEDVNAKCLILGHLAALYSIRCNPVADNIDINFDKSEMFNTITRCHVFIFIFSKETVNDSFYLNQLGIAKAYGVPVIGVREPSYFMPNPLPEQFYFTEIVDYTGINRDGKSTRGAGAKKQLLLADALIQDFKTAMVYAPEFHKSCFKRLVHKVSQAFNRSENEKQFYSSVYEQPKLTPFKELLNTTQEQAKKKTPKCPKCGFILSKQRDRHPPALQRASSTGSLLRKGDAFEGETSQQRQLFQSKKASLQPTTIVIPAPPYTGKHQTRPMTQFITTTRQPFKVNEPFVGKQQQQQQQQQQRQTIQQKNDKEKIDNENENNKEVKIENEKPEQDSNKTKTLRKQSRVVNGGWTDKLRNKLRRQSSLPVIPTTYLVTSPMAGEKQLSFVKYPPDSFLLSPRQSLLPIFSEDEEQETIHISRPPSPDGSSWSEKEKETKDTEG